MSSEQHLDALEREAYRASYDDGVVDLFVGLSLIWMGASWIWLHPASALAGILPAILAAPVLAARKRWVEARLGHVRWRPARRRWERRNLLAMVAAGTSLLLLGVLAWMLVEGRSVQSDAALTLSPGILAWLLAVLAIGLAFLMDARRFCAYAAILVAGGLLTVLAEALPGWPMLATGLIATGVGSVMVWRFIRRYPVAERM